MKSINKLVCALSLLAVPATSISAVAQAGWTHGDYSYSVNSYTEEVATDPNTSGYVIVEGPNSGACSSTASSTNPSDGATGWGKAQFSVTFTWSGGGTPGELDIQFIGSVSGLSHLTSPGTSIATSGVETDSAGGVNLYYSTTPNFTNDANGLPTQFLTPSSPKTFLFIASSKSTYSGNAGAQGSAGGYFAKTN